MPLNGADKHLNRLRRLRGPDMVRSVGSALFSGGELIQVEAQRLISAGAVSGKAHVPSAPGQPPNFDSGVLSANIETTHPQPLLVEVRSQAPYAAPLEFGTSKMAARPYMIPARNNKRREVRRLVEGAVAAAVRRSG